MLKKFGILVLFLLLGLFIYSSLVVYQANSYMDEVILKDYIDGNWRIYEGQERRLITKVEDLSSIQIDWLLKIQDPNFYQHDGIDLSTPGAGLTTISQSIVKKLYFNRFKPGVRKYKQSLIARFVVNEKLGKNEQLEIFINSAFMGVVEGKEVYGFAQASRIYFDKEVSQLDDNEYLSLVAMLIGPNQFNVIEAPEKNEARVARIKSIISGEYIPKKLTDVYYNRT